MKTRTILYALALALPLNAQPAHSNSFEESMAPQLNAFSQAADILSQKIQSENRPPAALICGEQGTFVERIEDCRKKAPQKERKKCFMLSAPLSPQTTPTEVGCDAKINELGQERVVWTLVAKSGAKEAWVFDDPALAADMLWVAWPGSKEVREKAIDFCWTYNPADIGLEYKDLVNLNVDSRLNIQGVALFHLPFVPEFEAGVKRGIIQAFATLNDSHGTQRFWSWSFIPRKTSDKMKFDIDYYAYGFDGQQHKTADPDERLGISCAAGLDKTGLDYK